MKIKYVLVILLTTWCNLCAQELTIKSFTEETNDLAASTNLRYDLNDIPCALVKVQLVTQGAIFEGNIIGSVENHMNEYWVYLSQGAKKLTIKTPGYLPKVISFADYGIASVAKKTTYKAVIDAPVLANQAKVNTQQYVCFVVEPKDAIVEMDGVVLTTLDGIATIRKPFGTYSYTVSANKYHSYQGSITVDNPTQRQEVKVLLKYAAGTLLIQSQQFAGAEVYIDGIKAGVVPFKQDMASGMYRVTIKKSLYADEEHHITINDEQTTEITPQLSPMFGYISVPETGNLKGGKVYINDKEVGKAPYKSGAMPAGQYSVKVIRDMYTSAEQVLSVGTGETSTFVQEIKPMFGYISVPETGTLKGGKVYINDKEVGKVPYQSAPMPTGQYSVKVMRDMYAPAEQVLSVGNGVTTTFNQNLSATFSNVTISVDGNAEIWVNDAKKGSGTWTGALNFGAYLIECKLANCRSTTKEIVVSSASNNTTILMAAPMPIKGTIDIASTPINADIYIDDKLVGKTPMIIPEIIIGEHTICISKNGYAPYKQKFVLSEGENKSFNEVLASMSHVTFDFIPQDAILTVDGVRQAPCTGTYQLPLGKHQIKVESKDYKTVVKDITLNSEFEHINLQIQDNYEYLNFTGEGTIGLSLSWYEKTEFPLVVEYSFDKTHWEKISIIDISSHGKSHWGSINKIRLEKNQSVYFRGGLCKMVSVLDDISFKISGKIQASGSIMSMYDFNPNGKRIYTSFCFSHLFCWCDGLIAAPALPATTLAAYCYSSMFYGCRNLVTAPTLPATTLAQGCYDGMFYGCKKISPKQLNIKAQMSASQRSKMFKK